MADRFTLEQKIMDCWQVVFDLDLLYRQHGETEMTDDEVQNLVLGLKTLYELRFRELFDTFEEVIVQAKIAEPEPEWVPAFLRKTGLTD